MIYHHIIEIQNTDNGLLYRRLGKVNGGLEVAKQYVRRTLKNGMGHTGTIAVLNERGNIAWRFD